MHLCGVGNGALHRALEIYLCILTGLGNGVLRRALEIYLCICVGLGNGCGMHFCMYGNENMRRGPDIYTYIYYIYIYIYV